LPLTTLLLNYQMFLVAPFNPLSQEVPLLPLLEPDLNQPILHWTVLKFVESHVMSLPLPSLKSNVQPQLETLKLLMMNIVIKLPQKD
jgi:hypothetical protein